MVAGNPQEERPFALKCNGQLSAAPKLADVVRAQPHGVWKLSEVAPQPYYKVPSRPGVTLLLFVGVVIRGKLGTCEMWNGELWCGEDLAPILKYHCKVWYKISRLWHKSKL